MCKCERCAPQYKPGATMFTKKEPAEQAEIINPQDANVTARGKSSSATGTEQIEHQSAPAGVSTPANSTGANNVDTSLNSNRTESAEKAAIEQPDKITVQDIVRDVYPWIIMCGEFNEQQKKAAYSMANCKTEELGGFMSYCPKCDEYFDYRYCSCGNRNCSLCQYPLEKRWVDMRKAEIIPGVQYYHLIPTLPHDLNPLFLVNTKEMAKLLFHASSEAIITICADPKVLGAKPGMISVMHTWNQLLELHVHAHIILTGGGLKPDGTFVNLIDLRKEQEKARLAAEQVKKETSNVSDNHVGQDSDQSRQDTSDSMDDGKPKYDYFFNIHAYMALFRAIYMSGLRELYNKRKLVLPESLDHLNHPHEWADFCYKLEHTDWVGYITKTFSGTNTSAFDRIGHYVHRNPMEGRIIESYKQEPENESNDQPEDSMYDDTLAPGESVGDAFDYLGRYAFRSAITNHRIESYENKTVSFWARDNAHPGQKKLVSMNVYEFVRRLLMHVLPKGFTRIRFSGFLSCACKTKNLEIIFQQVTNKGFKPSPLKELHGLELLQALFPDANYGICPLCGGKLQSIPIGDVAPHLARGVPDE